MFALVDCNNFYASCERVFQPQFRTSPIVILSNNDGCVIARSDEAKTIGVPMGAPAFKYNAFFKEHHVQVFSSNYPLYGDMSSRVMSILKQFSPNVETYSIDEAFMLLHSKEDYNTLGHQMRNRVLQWTGLPTCVGIAPTKALSKVANKIARKFPQKTGGVYVIDSEDKRIKALKWTKIKDVWGIGRRIEKRLSQQNIVTAYDFTQLSDNWVKTQLSITELNLKKDLEGIVTLDLEDDHPIKKSIATTRSFQKSHTNIRDIKERVATFANSCAEKLRAQNSSCNMLIVLLQGSRFDKNQQSYKTSVTAVLPYTTNSSITIVKNAITAVDQLYQKGVKYKRAGVIVTGLVPTNNHQLDLFSNENPKHLPLMKAIDKLNKKYGDDKLKIANQDIQKTWKMKQEHLSQQYTTQFNDILIIK
ncbi:MAG: Y-family DNA polymerase [Flavobacteriaceae bacterium]